jgi:ABC-type antimicrobial peptide transport system permease subunit
VHDRTRDGDFHALALRKAVGARPSAILLQFLVEAVVLCLIGGAIGLALGQALTTTVASFLPQEANIDPWSFRLRRFYWRSAFPRAWG